MTHEQGIELADALNALVKKHSDAEEIDIWATFHKGKFAFTGRVVIDSESYWAHDMRDPREILPEMDTKVGPREVRRANRLKKLSEQRDGLQELIDRLNQPTEPAKA